MAKYIVNDKHVMSTDYYGEKPPAWQDPSGKAEDDPDQSRFNDFRLDPKRAVENSLNHSYDRVNKITPKRVNKNLFVVTGHSGYLNHEIINRLPYSAVPVPYADTEKNDRNLSMDSFANRQSLLDTNLFYEKYGDVVKKEILVTDRWLINSIVDEPTISCLWDKAKINPFRHIILYNEDVDEVSKIQFQRYKKEYDKIVKKNNHIYELNELNSRYKGDVQIEHLNYAWRHISKIFKNCILLNCKGLQEYEIVNEVYYLIKKSKGGIQNDKTSKRRSTKAKAKRKRKQ